MSLNKHPLKTHGHTEPQEVTLFSNRVFGDVTSENGALPGGEWALDPTTGVFTKEKKRRRHARTQTRAHRHTRGGRIPGTRKAETDATLRQTAGRRGLPAAARNRGRGLEQTFPGASRRSRTSNTWVSDAGLHNCEKTCLLI